MAAGAGVEALGGIDPRMAIWGGENAMRLLKLLLVLFACAATPASAGPLEDGRAAYDRGDYATALRLWGPLADQGNPSAQYRFFPQFSRRAASRTERNRSPLFDPL